MKKEELSAALVSALGTNTNLSERTVSAYAEQTASVMGEDYEMTDDFVQKHANVLRSMGGQLSHDISAGIDAWKLKNQPNPIPNPPQNLVPNTGNEAFDELKKQIEELKSQLDNANVQKTRDAYCKELRSKLKSKLGSGVNEYILDDVVNTGSWDVSKSVDAVIGDAETSYNAKYKKCFGTGPAPRTPRGNSETKEAMAAKREAFRNKLRSEGKLPGKDA